MPQFCQNEYRINLCQNKNYPKISLQHDKLYQNFCQTPTKNVKTMKNLQKLQKTAFSHRFEQKSKRAKQSVQQSADFAITDFSRVNF